MTFRLSPLPPYPVGSSPMTMAIPVATAMISIRISITIVEGAVAAWITIISIAIVIPRTVAVTTYCDTARQCQADEK